MYIDPLGDITNVVTTVDGSRRYQSLDGVIRVQARDTVVFSLTSPTELVTSWLKDGDVLQSSSRITSAQSGVIGRVTSELAVRDAVEGDRGTYTGVFLNNAGVISRSATIEVVGTYCLS